MKKSKTSKSKETASAAKQTAKPEAKAPKPESRAKRSKPRPSKGEKKPKRVSALDAAAQVLSKADKPMRAQELIEAMAESGLWKSPGGKTPHATLYAAMMREERDKKNASRFKKVDRGMFTFSG